MVSFRFYIEINFNTPWPPGNEENMCSICNTPWPSGNEVNICTICGVCEDGKQSRQSVLECHFVGRTSG